MKILVGLKRVIDHKVNIRVKQDGSGVEDTNVRMSMNPFDEVALEQAVRLKEAHKADEVVAVSIGPQKCEETLRVALAMGADRAILVLCDQTLEPPAVAGILAELAERESPDLIMVGKQAIDDDAAQTGPMLAGRLRWAQGCFVSRLELEGQRLSLTCEADRGAQELEMDLPAVISADLELVQPRKATLPNVMKARKKPLAVLPLEDLACDIEPRHEILKTMPAPSRPPVQMLNSLEELEMQIRNAGAGK